jgi:hypothetical protein
MKIGTPRQIKRQFKTGEVVRFKRYGDLNVDLSKSLREGLSYKNQTLEILEAVVEKIINFTPKYGDEYEIEVFRAQQRVKAKEILSKISK